MAAAVLVEAGLLLKVQELWTELVLFSCLYPEVLPSETTAKTQNSPVNLAKREELERVIPGGEERTGERRFISEDPAQSGTSWYAYASNSPLVNVDVTGLDDTPAADSSSGGGDFWSGLKSGWDNFWSGGGNNNQPASAPRPQDFGEPGLNFDYKSYTTAAASYDFNNQAAGFLPGLGDVGKGFALGDTSNPNAKFGAALGMAFAFGFPELSPEKAALQDAFKLASDAKTTGVLAESTFRWQGKTVAELADAHLTDSGVAVLGPFRNGGDGDYIKRAQELKASYFDVGPDAWKAMSPEERTAANQRFLDTVVQRQDKILLSIPKSQIPTSGSLAWEIQQLTQTKDYVWANQWSLVPRK